MEITVAGTRPTRRAPKENFTGTVWQDPVIMAPAPARLNCSRVAFEPGARTNWHHHPLGQTLYVISGVGRVQTKGGPVRRSVPATLSGFHRASCTGTGVADQRHVPHRHAGSARRRLLDLVGAGH